MSRTMVMGNRAHGIPKDASESSAPTVCTGETVAVVHLRGVVEVQRNGDVRDATREPVHTVRAGGQHHGIVMRNNEGGAEMSTPTHEPIRTLTSRGHQSLVVPYYSQSIPTAGDDTPAQTVTTKDRLALVVPAGGSWQDEATSVADPLATQTGRESKAIAWTDEEIDDCRFRMFALHEIAGAMRLDRHQDGREYIVTGNKRERMAQYGNAVTPPAMALIVSRLLEVIEAETFTDMFCGAGGSSLGAEFAGGRMRLGLNHWARAIETHSANFEHADHDCADVSLADPRRYPSTDILMASPECTNHSLAKGARRRKPQAASLWEDGPSGDAEQDKSRATMWDVVRFAEAMIARGKPYKAIVVENVVDAFKWGANDDGGLFASWLIAMDNLGYEHEIVWLNSMLAHAPGGIMVPQSRDRMYPVFWLKGIRRPNLKFNPICWCTRCEKIVNGAQTWKRPTGRVWGRYGPQYFYTCPDCRSTAIPGAAPADTIIDWNLPAERIGDRVKPLAENTVARIRRGLERLASEPFAIRLLQSGAPKTLTLPLVTLTARHDMAMVLPVAGNTFERTSGNRARDAITTPLDTVHGTLDRGLVMANTENNVPRPVEREPTQTLRTEGGLAMVVPPMGGVVPRASSEPTPTQTTTTRAGLVTK